LSEDLEKFHGVNAKMQRFRLRKKLGKSQQSGKAELGKGKGKGKG
jgi:hypothetical protein